MSKVRALKRRKLAAGVRRGALLCLGALSCVRNPATGERQLNLVSENQEIELGKQSAEEVARSIGILDDESLERYVERVGQKLAAVAERPGLPWTFKVVDDPAVNAFALPGGYVFVARGLLAHLENEAQLATVMGHEIGHVTAEHSVNQLSKAQLAGLGIGLGSLVAPRLGQLSAAGLELLFLKFGRDDERQADDLGVRYVNKAHYDLREAPRVYEMLARVSKEGGESARLPGWLMTHPEPEERVARTRARIQRLLPSSGEVTKGEAELMAALDGMVYGENPREGFFRGSRFYHPELAFSIEFPEHWQKLNGKTEVVALSPEQDGALQLSSGPDMEPQEALATFFASSGATQTSEPHKLGRAIAATFSADEGQGAIRGMIAFLTHGGHTIQVLGLAEAGAYPMYAEAFARSIASFEEVSDPAVLDAGPNVLRTAKLTRKTALSELHRQHSAVPLEELALINQVDTHAVLPEGAYVKWVESGAGAELVGAVDER